MTGYRVRSLVLVGAVTLGLVGSIGLIAQGQAEFTNNIKFDSGQDVQPVFDGWAKAANGTFDLYFGYLNRNWVETLAIPVGPNNNIQPSGPDRGQPTFFYTRTNRKVFTVSVPADFGKSELVWTLTANGKTRTVYGHLKSDWEITPDGGAAGTRTTAEARSNKAPTMTLEPVGPANMVSPATLVAAVSDDGLPKPRPPAKAAVGQETPPALAGGPKDPGNLPWLNKGEKRPLGLTVRWMVYRGPADVRFEPAYAQPADGKATTTARFLVPGDYVLRAAAEDGFLTTYRDVRLTVSR